MGQSVQSSHQENMKSGSGLPAVINLLVSFTSVWCRPQNSFRTNSFSNFDPTSRTFTAGSSTNLHQESFSNADDFLLSFEKLFPQTNSDEAFNIFSSNGECDDFCQNVLALDAQSQAKFEQDLSDFQAQFGNSLPLAPAPAPAPGSPQRPAKTQAPRVQTQSSSFLPNQRDNALKTDESFKSNTNRNKENKNFLFFGNNQKNSNQPTQFQSPNKNRNPRPPPTTTTRRPEPSTSPFTVFTTKRTTRKPTTSPARTRPTTAGPVNTTTKKSTKIKWTFNGKTIGTSTIPQNSPGKSDTAGDNEALPISTYFNEVEGERQERKETGREEKSNDFPVFDAVPF